MVEPLLESKRHVSTPRPSLPPSRLFRSPLFYLDEPPGVRVKVLGIFVVDRGQLSPRGGLREQGVHEEPAKDVQSPVQMPRVHVEVIVRVLSGKRKQQQQQRQRQQQKACFRGLRVEIEKCVLSQEIQQYVLPLLKKITFSIAQ